MLDPCHTKQCDEKERCKANSDDSVSCGKVKLFLIVHIQIHSFCVMML